MTNRTTETCSPEIQKKNSNGGDGNDHDDMSFSRPQPSSLFVIDEREKKHRILLVVFASLSILFYAGSVCGWGPMQLMLEANGNFASLCDNESGNTATTNIDNDNDNDNDIVTVCQDQTAAFLTCKSVSQLTMLTGTLWGALSDKYGNRVLVYVFGLCNILGLILLIIAVSFPATVIDGPSMYGAFILIGLAATPGGMLTVETGLLLNDHRTQTRVISLLNAMFDSGAMTYLGLWSLEKLTSSSSSTSASNTNLIFIFGGYLVFSVVCIGGFTYFFQTINSINNNRDSIDDQFIQGDVSNEEDDNEEEKLNGGDPNQRRRISFVHETIETLKPIDEKTTLPSPAPSPAPLPSNDNDEEKVNGGDPNHCRRVPFAHETIETLKSIEEKTTLPAPSPSPLPSNSHRNRSYIPICERSAKDQLRSKTYVLMGIWFSFNTVSNLWTLTSARDFLGELGDNAYGNRYLSIFTLMTPISLLALPFLDAALNRLGFHASLQLVNGLAIAHLIIKVAVRDLNVQILGFVFFTFFRCFLYALSFSVIPAFIGPEVVGRATGTLFVISGLASFANVGLAQLAVIEGGFFICDLSFLIGSIPMVYLTYEIGRALEEDRQAIESKDGKMASLMTEMDPTERTSFAVANGDLSSSFNGGVLSRTHSETSAKADFTDTLQVNQSRRALFRAQADSRGSLRVDQSRRALYRQQSVDQSRRALFRAESQRSQRMTGPKRQLSIQRINV